MHRRPVRIATIIALGIAAACATPHTPQQLIDARAAYRRAAQGPAAEYAPTHLESARRALVRAEQAFQHSPGSEETTDLAYIAERLAQVADAQAEVTIAQKDKSDAESALRVAQERKANETREKLDQTREELARVEGSKEAEESRQQRELDIQTTKLDEARKQVERERQARIEAQRAASQAQEALGKIASVKEEARGTVITLPGEVLFTSGQATLLPGAAERLGAVVDAMRELKDRHVVIEGHTDSTGSPAANRELSERRASTVREYLVRHGIPAERIETKGMGADVPVDSNDTPEGRAHNRRVEIILERVAS